MKVESAPLMRQRQTAIREARRHLDRGRFEDAWTELERAPQCAQRQDGSLREIRLECCLALARWVEAADLADALLHDGLKRGAVARFHCAYARHRLEMGDRSRALWELGIALQTDAEMRSVILGDEVLRGMLWE